ncbi:hypothetical protein HYV69_00255 [Candidatus Uhrbacteria bacterium]|nr:hypothetical protein [Candidatus Uhrbacteria bacterium]
MKFSNLKVGDWFEFEGKRYIKIESAVRHNIECLAVNLSTGHMAFPAAGTSFNIHDVEVEPILKPSWAERK